jgi:hypothetical protein
LTATGVTIFMTAEIVGSYPDVHFTTEKVSFITDDIIVQRFVEVDGGLRTVLSIYKMRGSEHNHDFLTYDITSKGAVVGGPLKNFKGIITGVPELQLRLTRPSYDGLTDGEAALLDTIVRLGGASRELLAERIGLPPAKLKQALGRLEELGYATVAQGAGGTYRAVAQLGG